MNVLLVEDSLVTAEATRALLELRGHAVRWAADGAQGMAEVARGLPGAVVLDLQMPVMDGEQFLYAFRRVPGCAGVPVFLTTATSDRDLARLAPALMALGPVTVLRKPYPPEQLMALLKECETCCPRES